MGVYLKGLTEEQFRKMSWECVYTALKRQNRIIEVKEPHGRLIDASELEPDAEWDDYQDGFISYSAMQVWNATTVIEAEGEE